MDRKYTVDELISIARRENNAKRSYLYVNPVQGKHVPVSPSASLALFSRMAHLLESWYPDEQILLIGFAETATAIGAAIARKAKNVSYYMTTTRENIPGASYLYFTESHSHASEQRLVQNGLGPVLSRVCRIVFAEDEVTTGKTIGKLISVLKEKYDCGHIRFSMISVLNSMSSERLALFRREEIDCIFLYQIPSGYRTGEIENYVYKPLDREIGKGSSLSAKEIPIPGRWDPRIVCSKKLLCQKLDAFLDLALLAAGPFEGLSSLLILGTEECMIPGMLLGERIEQDYPSLQVKFHATTRSPIEISDGEGYPLRSRSPLKSLYDRDRKTFLYNLAKADRVLIVTDASPVSKEGLKSLLFALEKAGNETVRLLIWEDEPL